MGFTRKKLQFTAVQRSDILRAKYQAEVSMYDSSMFVFLMRLGGCTEEIWLLIMWISGSEYQAPINGKAFFSNGSHDYNCTP